MNFDARVQSAEKAFLDGTPEGFCRGCALVLQLLGESADLPCTNMAMYQIVLGSIADRMRSGFLSRDVGQPLLLA